MTDLVILLLFLNADSTCGNILLLKGSTWHCTAWEGSRLFLFSLRAKAFKSFAQELVGACSGTGNAVGQQDPLSASLCCWTVWGWVWGHELRAELTSIACPRVHRQLPGDLGEDLPLHLGPLLVLIALLVSVGHVELQAQATRGAVTHGEQREHFKYRWVWKHFYLLLLRLIWWENVVVKKTKGGSECWRARILWDINKKWKSEIKAHKTTY